MATSFSDMMNEPMAYSLGYNDSSSNGGSNKSASLSMQHNQMMTSPVASTIIPTVTTTATPIDHQYHHIQQQQQQYYYQQYVQHMVRYIYILNCRHLFQITIYIVIQKNEREKKEKSGK